VKSDLVRRTSGRSSTVRRSAIASLAVMSFTAVAPPVGGAVAYANSVSAPTASAAKKSKAQHERRVSTCAKGALSKKSTYLQFARCLKTGTIARGPKPKTKTVYTTVDRPVPGPTVTVPEPSAPAASPAKKAKNIILLIGDGMGVTHIDAARQRFYGANGKLNMEKSPVQGTVSTYAVNEGSDKPNYVTDSASAATAWSSGVKTYNNALGKDTRGNIVPTIMEQAKAKGMRTGNVSNAEITDATPAGMFSHVSARACQGPVFTAGACVRPSGQGASDVPIAEQIARNNVADVILGGGLSRFEPADSDAMKANGYQVLGSFGDPAILNANNGGQSAATQRTATTADLDAITGRNQRVIGLFNRGNMTVEKSKTDNPTSTAATNEPGVAKMTSKAIELLANSDQGAAKGFFLQVEGALIDKRSHANDAAQVLAEMKEFDDAVKAARDFAAADGNTLVIVTADHECAGFNIIESKTFTNAEALTPPGNVDSGNTANNSSPSRPFAANGAEQKDISRSPGSNLVGGSNNTVPSNSPSNTNANSFAPATFRTADDPEGVTDGSPAASLWLTYLSGNHTGADVNIYTSGPQADLFKGKQDNTDIFREMRSALQTDLG
jgi:alkaline phosphatase